MLSKKIYLMLFCSLVIVITGCEKFLDAKPKKTLTVPSTLMDFQALMDNTSKLSSEPHEGEFSTDDHYLTTAHWESLASEEERRVHVWEKDYLFSFTFNSWSNCYTAIYYCNTALEGLEKISKNAKNSEQWNHIKGQALYLRAKRLLQASFVWTLAYDKTSSNTDLGLPLRLNTNFNETSVRSTLEETYQQIIKDLKPAIGLLPITPITKVRPSKPAAYALLSRTYLAMRDYVNAGLYADSCLQLFNTLIDYNDLDEKQPEPLTRFNEEVISENGIGQGQSINLTRGRINPDLYNLYDKDNDLRKEILFSNNADETHGFKGRFAEASGLFGGMASNEAYLTRAECYARDGKVKEALDDINTLLVKRWRKNEFVPIKGLNAAATLDLVLTERRKELLFRGIRWMDIKRLNKEGRNIILTRNVNNKIYTLKPDDLRYALPIPEDVIIQSGMQQNRR